MLCRFEEAHADALARAHQIAFSVDDRADLERWWDHAGRENLRVWLREGQVVAGLVGIPMGIFAGGRSVPMRGVAGVAVLPEARGAGVAAAMMAAWLREAASEGVATSALYASTRSLYRRVGYDVAGERWLGTAPLDVLRTVGQRDGDWRPIQPGDRAAIEAAYARASAPWTGRLDRGPYVWRRIWEHEGRPTTGWWLPGPHGPSAWVVLRKVPDASTFGTVHVLDHHADDALALRRLVGLLSTFGADARTLSIKGPTPIWDLLPEHRAELRLFEPWLLRVVDLHRALTARGWPSGLRATLSLQVDDPVLAANHGRFTVRIEDGQASVQAGGDGAVRLSARALASLFTGHADPWTLALRGELAAPPASLPPLAAAFAGPAPLLGDYF